MSGADQCNTNVRCTSCCTARRSTLHSVESLRKGPYPTRHDPCWWVTWVVSRQHKQPGEGNAESNLRNERTRLEGVSLEGGLPRPVERLLRRSNFFACERRWRSSDPPLR